MIKIGKYIEKIILINFDKKNNIKNGNINK